MTTRGIEAVFLETHNWGKTAKFLQDMGFEIEFETGHNSGQFRNETGPYVFVAEIPPSEPTRTRLVLQVDSARNHPGGEVDIVSEFEQTHYGTQEMVVRDPDGRLWNLQAPLDKQ
ncbi:glyoxalase/bleomycin resistance/dioxygenase family protein [Nocardia niigatensis]|uniref:glyoxalase/bleomycin resistance/dioxygenase family protein n=1 Tax=Nocardia niigatensis TaxID=209249 RepID=UPI0002F87632|nr:glyoxalase/bleomycin resistance/dioxygenase family protein [Nocardia niigatensis]